LASLLWDIIESRASGECEIDEDYYLYDGENSESDEESDDQAGAESEEIEEEMDGEDKGSSSSSSFQPSSTKKDQLFDSIMNITSTR